MFPDQGTIIAQGDRPERRPVQGVRFPGRVRQHHGDLQRRRGYATVSSNDKKLDESVKDAVDNKIPVYLVRTNYDKTAGPVIPDELWIPAIAKTGGKFYAAEQRSEPLIAAIEDIDKVAAGTIQVTAVQQSDSRGSRSSRSIAVGVLVGSASRSSCRPALSEADVSRTQGASSMKHGRRTIHHRGRAVRSAAAVAGRKPSWRGASRMRYRAASRPCTTTPTIASARRRSVLEPPAAAAGASAGDVRTPPHDGVLLAAARYDVAERRRSTRRPPAPPIRR